ncbi:MAG: hypothetical protein ACRCTQ_04630 [Brevinemataceae bacterium]
MKAIKIIGSFIANQCSIKLLFSRQYRNKLSQRNIKVGRIGIQKKGRDGGRPTANMLQFKINPMDLFNI